MAFIPLLFILNTMIIGIVLGGRKTTKEKDIPSPTAPEKDDVNTSYEYKVNDDDQTMTLQFNADWEKTMSDYDSDYIYTIPISYKEKEIYFENITQVPSRFRGAFLIDEGSKYKIDFEILDPDNNRVYFNTSHQCIFDVNITKPGKYYISFYNRYMNQNLKVTYTMNSGQNIILKKEDLTLTEQKLDNLDSFIKRFNVEFKFNRNIHKERYKKIIKTNKYFYTFSILETCALIGISIWQFYYMKHLFEIKGSL